MMELQEGRGRKLPQKKKQEGDKPKNRNWTQCVEKKGGGTLGLSFCLSSLIGYLLLVLVFYYNVEGQSSGAFSTTPLNRRYTTNIGEDTTLLHKPKHSLML